MFYPPVGTSISPFSFTNALSSVITTALSCKNLSSSVVLEIPSCPSLVISIFILFSVQWSGDRLKQDRIFVNGIVVLPASWQNVSCNSEPAQLNSIEHDDKDELFYSSVDDSDVLVDSYVLNGFENITFSDSLYYSLNT